MKIIENNSSQVAFYSVFLFPSADNNTMNTIITTTQIADEIFESTGFNYDIAEQENDDGTVTLTFDSKDDAAKFESMIAFFNN